MSESDTRAKRIDPAIHARGWTEDLIRREETAGAGVKTNLLFFTCGRPTERIWYYDLSDLNVGKKTPLTLNKFADFFRLLPERADSERSSTVTREQIEALHYDLKAVYPHARRDQDTRTSDELLDLIEAKGHDDADALSTLHTLMNSSSIT